MSLMIDDLTGIQRHLGNEEYHAGPGLSFTGFKEFMKYPAKYKAYLERKKESTPSQLKGQLFHMAVLEPEVFAKKAVHMEGPMNRSIWKKAAEDARDEGKIPVSDNDWGEIMGMCESVQKHPDASRIVNLSQHELSCFWKDPEHDVLLKCRPDCLFPDTGLMADLKYCSDASFPEVQKQIVRMKYHIQSKWYLNGLSNLIGKPLTDFLHIFVEEKYPHRCEVFMFDDASLDRAQVDISYWLAHYAKRFKEDFWPMSHKDQQINTMNLPSWAFEEGLTDE